MEKILLLGDSFTFGAGCSDVPRTTGVSVRPSKFGWGSLLSDYTTDLDVINLSNSGRDNLSILEDLWQNMSNEIYLIVFCASYHNRFQVCHPTVDTETCTALPNFINESASRDYAKSLKNFYKYLYNDHMGWNHSASTIMAAYACSRILQCKFLWSAPENLDYGSMPDILQHLKQYQFPSAACFEFGSHELAPCKHPNDLGHLRYFNQVIKPFFEPHLRGSTNV